LLEGNPPTEAQAQEHLLFAYEAICKAAQVPSGRPTSATEEDKAAEQEVHLLAIGLLMRVGKLMGLM